MLTSLDECISATILLYFIILYIYFFIITFYLYFTIFILNCWVLPVIFLAQLLSTEHDNISNTHTAISQGSVGLRRDA